MTPQLILRVGVLTDAQIRRDLLLGVAVVNSEIAYILKFQDFIPHTITREQNTTSEIRILDFIWNTDRIRLSTQAIGYIQQSNKLEFKKNHVI